MNMRKSSSWLRKSLSAMMIMMLSASGTALAQGAGTPEDVENVVATPMDKAVKLTWDEAEDDGIIYQYKIYYGTSSVSAAEDTYDADIAVDGAETEYTVSNLLNDVQYYFAITAVDDQSNESLNYSFEVSAVPTATSSASENPELISATHTAPKEVLVIMSESVQIDSNVDSFRLENRSKNSEVTISNTLVNSEKVTVITSEDLVPGDQYFVTATSGVTDLDGNPVSSGITDTIDFIALADFPEPEPEVINEPITPTETPLEEIIEDEPVIDDLPLTSTDDDFLDGDNFLDTFLENPDNVPDEEPELETLIEEDEPTTPTNEEPQSSAPDAQPPQDARNLNVDAENASSTGKVMITWTPALDIDEDIADQVLYTRVGIGQWDQGYSLGKDVSSTELDVDPNQNYQVRIVTVDRSGNESFGTNFTFSTNLSQSGSNLMYLAMAVGLMLGMFMLFGRRSTA